MEWAWWVKGLAGCAASVALVNTLPPRLWMPHKRATVDYLAAATLHSLDGSNTTIQEGRELSSLMSSLKSRGINLYAVVREDYGVEEFRKYFKGVMFLDKKRVFYGPEERKMFWSGLMRWNTYFSGARAYSKGIEGNVAGNGNILGGVFVIGPGSRGIVLEGPNMDFGSTVDVDGVMEAVVKIHPDIPCML